MDKIKIGDIFRFDILWTFDFFTFADGFKSMRTEPGTLITVTSTFTDPYYDLTISDGVEYVRVRSDDIFDLVKSGIVIRIT